MSAIKDVRCRGMIGAIEFEKEHSGLARKVQLNLREKGILVRPLGNVVYLMLPLVTPKAVLCETINILFESVKTFDA